MVISGDAIQVYEADGTTVVNAIDFGTTFVDSFGNVETPTHQVVVKNLSGTVVQVTVTGDGGDGIIPVFGPTAGDLKTDAENAFVLQSQGQSGDMLMGWVGLTLPTPTSGSKTTTIIFNAIGTGGAPAGPLSVAVECNTGSQNCETSTESAFKIRDVLIQSGGHTAAVVDGSDIATTADLSNYDVVVIGESGHNDNDFADFQTALRQWVQNGGGVVATTWIPIVFGTHADLDAILPIGPPSTSTIGGTITMTGDPSHPVTNGVSNFISPSNNSSGSLRQGATLLAMDSVNNPAVAVWQFGQGRVVYLSPEYLASYSNFTNEPLLDGSIPDALNLFLQAVQWAGGS